MARWSKGGLTFEYLENQPLSKVFAFLEDAEKISKKEKVEFEKQTKR